MNTLFGDISKPAAQVVEVPVEAPKPEPMFICLDDSISDLLQEMYEDPKCYAINIVKLPDGRVQLSANMRERYKNWNVVLGNDINECIATVHQREKFMRALSNTSPQYSAK